MSEIQPKKLRVFWNSNAPWSTSGYGQAMKDLLPLIRDEGYPLAISNFFGQQGGKFALDGILQYPVINHVYGSDAMVLHAKDFQADVTFSLQDSWVLNPEDLKNVTRYIPWLPVDHDPIPRIILERMKFAYRIITMSKFGQKQLQNNGLYSTYIPHTVDTDIFKPLDKKQRKKDSNLPEDSFIIGMVAANKDNPPRKSFQEAMDAFKMFLEREPKALLYIHTNPEFPGGFPLREYANFIGITDKVMFPDTYQLNFNIHKEQMNLIYNTFDVLLAPSRSEGFCVPLIEAQSCGVPVIANDFTAMSELVEVGKTGILTKVAYKAFSGMGSYMGVPDLNSIFNALVTIHKADRVKMGENARKAMVDNYDLKKVYKEKWSPFIAKLEKEVYPLANS